MGRYLEELFNSTYSLFNLYQTCTEENTWTTKEELREIAGFSIEIWNTLCEEEISAPNYALIKSSQTQQGFIWQSVASLMMQGLNETGFEIENHDLEDDTGNSFAIDCAQGLRFLSQVIGNDMLDMTYQYVSNMMTQGQTQ